MSFGNQGTKLVATYHADQVPAPAAAASSNSSAPVAGYDVPSFQIAAPLPASLLKPNGRQPLPIGTKLMAGAEVPMLSKCPPHVKLPAAPSDLNG